MGFGSDIKEKALIAAARHCSVCHRYKGLKIEVHHIVQESQGGANSFDNAIALCFDCHADAGHYNNNHPKGTKFSPNELRKARDEWYKLVSTHKIQAPIDSSNDLHIRYLICKDYDDAFKITNNDLSVIPIEKTLLAENEILKFFKWIAQLKKASFSNWTAKNNWFKDANEYQSRYPDAKRIDKSNPKNPYFLCERIPTTEELLSEKFNIDAVSKVFLANGIDPELFSKVHSYPEECGGGNGDKLYTESVRFRPLWFVFIAITNMSSNHVRMDTLFGMYNSLLKSFRSFEDSSNDEEYKFKFSDSPIGAAHTVIIPSALILAPMETLDIEELVLSSDTSSLEVIKQFSKVTGFHMDQKKFYLFGPAIKPSKITYSENANLKTTTLHPFNLERLYFLSQDWQIGSCPHLFYESSTGKLTYVKELFSKNPNSIEKESFVIPEKVVRAFIAELEDEETFIQSIKINNIIIEESITLVKGSVFEICVTGGDVLELVGKYHVLFHNSSWDSILRRAELIGKFMYSFYSQNALKQ